MEAFSIRLEPEMYQKIEDLRGGKTRSDYIRTVLAEHIKNRDANTREPQENRGEPLKIETVTKLEDEIEYLREKVDSLLQLLHQEQMIHLQTQKQLPAPVEMQKRKWWQFWKG